MERLSSLPSVATVSSSKRKVRDDPESIRRLDQFETEDGSRYVRFATLGKLGVDNVEFLIKNEGIGDRGWDGDEGESARFAAACSVSNLRCFYGAVGSALVS